MQHNVEGGVAGVEQVLKRNKLFSEHRFEESLSSSENPSSTPPDRCNSLQLCAHADKEAEEKKSHLVTLNEVRSYFFQEGESFPHSYHKRWKIIMHIKAGAGGRTALV